MSNFTLLMSKDGLLISKVGKLAKQAKEKPEVKPLTYLLSAHWLTHHASLTISALRQFLENLQLSASFQE